MGAPAEQRVAGGVVGGVVVAGHVDGLARLDVPLVLGVQGVLVVLGVADDEDLAAGFGGEQHRACCIALGQHAQVGAGVDGGAVRPGPTAVGGIEHLIEAAHQRVGGAGHAMLKHAEHFFWQMHLGNAKMVVQPGQRTPAQVDGGVDVLLGIVHDGAQLVPVVHILVVQVLDGRTGDDHAVEALVSYLVEALVEGLHVLRRGVGGVVGGGFQKGDLHLQRAVGQQPGQLGLGDDLGGHQVQNQDAQRADVLALGTLAVHDKDVLAAKLVERGQLFRDDQRHTWFSLPYIIIYIVRGYEGKCKDFVWMPLCTASISLVHKSFAIYPIDILHHRATILAVERIEC